jgi:hypothetical protein
VPWIVEVINAPFVIRKYIFAGVVTEATSIVPLVRLLQGAPLSAALKNVTDKVAEVVFIMPNVNSVIELVK